MGTVNSISADKSGNEKGEIPVWLQVVIATAPLSVQTGDQRRTSAGTPVQIEEDNKAAPSPSSRPSSNEKSGDKRKYEESSNKVGRKMAKCSNKHAKRWDEMFEKLCDYKQTYGHC